MPLEEALALFEAGVQLSRLCNQTLAAAERRIEILVADRADSLDASREPAVEPFDSADDDEEDFED